MESANSLQQTGSHATGQIKGRRLTDCSEFGGSSSVGRPARAQHLEPVHCLAP